MIAAGPTLDRYVPLLGNEVEELRALARPLAGAEVLMVNSTAVGGGVAEAAGPRGAAVRRAESARGVASVRRRKDFFEVTKAFHNALHGGAFHGGRKPSRYFAPTANGTWRVCTWTANSS